MPENNKLKYKTIKETLNKLSERVDFKTGKHRPSLYSLWEQIVGERLYLNSNLYDIQNNTIIIEVEHTGFSQQIKLTEKKILYNVNKYYPELNINKIEIKLSSNFSIKQKESINNKNEILTNKEDNVANKIIENNKISMPNELKDLFKKIRKDIKKTHSNK